MWLMHRTTVRLDEHLLAQAKEYAARHRRSFTAVVEDALRALLAQRKKPIKSRRGRVKLPVSKQTGGLRPGVDLENRDQMWDLAGWP
jgi:plasmid stability protein